jgi:hypothetical protein
MLPAVGSPGQAPPALLVRKGLFAAAASTLLLLVVVSLTLLRTVPALLVRSEAAAGLPAVLVLALVPWQLAAGLQLAVYFPWLLVPALWTPTSPEGMTGVLFAQATPAAAASVSLRPWRRGDAAAVPSRLLSGVTAAASGGPGASGGGMWAWPGRRAGVRRCQ